jgi:twinkle protein
MSDTHKPTIKDLLPAGEFKPLAKRKLTATTLQKYGYSVGTAREGDPVHIAPYYSKATGDLTAQKLRYANKEFRWAGRTKEPIQLFGQQIWNGGGKMLTITEGELDCLSLSQVQGNKSPVVSVPNGAQGATKSIRDNLDFVESFDRVVLMFDNDEPGRKAAQECALLLSPGKAHIATLPLKDASDMLQAGRAEELIRCMWEAKVYRPDGLIGGSELLEDLLREPQAGYMTPYPGLNDMIKGIRKGELCLFTAGSGIGKSTLVHEIGYHFLTQYNLRLGVIALEENKRRTAERYIGIKLNRPIHLTRDDVTEEEIKAAFTEVFDNDRFWLYDHFGSTNIDTLLAKIRYLAVALTVDFIILDHISIVVSGLDDGGGDGGERKLIDKLMTRLRSLVEETGTGLIGIVHLKRPDTGKAFTEGRQVSLSDLRGSGSLEQLSDVVIALERNQQDPECGDISTLRVLKNRPVGTVGPCGHVAYDSETGRLLDKVMTENPFEEPTKSTKTHKKSKRSLTNEDF